MFREFELILWSCFCTDEKIKEIILEAEEDSVEQIKKNILSHLIYTAYYSKQKVTHEEQFEAFRAFFNSYFTIFEGKHTDWLLLNEPDMTTINPQVLNKRYEELY